MSAKKSERYKANLCIKPYFNVVNRRKRVFENGKWVQKYDTLRRWIAKGCLPYKMRSAWKRTRQHNADPSSQQGNFV